MELLVAVHMNQISCSYLHFHFIGWAISTGDWVWVWTWRPMGYQHELIQRVHWHQSGNNHNSKFVFAYSSMSWWYIIIRLIFLLSICVLFLGCTQTRCSCCRYVPCCSGYCRSILGIPSKTMGYGCWCFGNANYPQDTATSDYAILYPLSTRDSSVPIWLLFLLVDIFNNLFLVK